MSKQLGILLPFWVLLYSAGVFAQADVSCGTDVQSAPVKRAAKATKPHQLSAYSAKKRSRAAHVDSIYPAIVLRTQGIIELVAQKGAALPHPKLLSMGDVLNLGDVFQTKEQSFISIRLGDGTVSTLPSNSRVELTRSSPKVARIVLQQGAIENRVRKNTKNSNIKLEIQIPNAIIGVRGTDFKVRASSQSLPASSTVNEGLVSIQSRYSCSTNALMVKGGEGAYIDTTGQAHAAPLLASPILLKPDSAQTAQDIEFDFQPNPLASQYHAQIAVDPYFWDVRAESYATLPHVSFKNLAVENGFYYLKLTPLDKNGVEGFSRVHVFLRAKK